jgi:hypothetical protein
MEKAMFRDRVRYPAHAAVLTLMLAVGQFAQAGSEPAKANPPAEPQKPVVEVIRITIHPAAEPKPALKYHLLPTFLEQTPGNAVPLFLKVVAMFERGLEELRGKPENKFGNPVEMTGAPLDKFPRDRARKLLDAYGDVLSQIDLMARRERCDWDAPLRQGHVYDILLPEVHESRHFARLVALRARLQIAEGKYAEAVVSLQTGYALGRQISQQPFLISGLVGIGIVEIMNSQVLDLCQQPNAPNLYWSLTALPRPMVNLYESARYEYNGIYLQFPELQDVRCGQHTPDQWDAILRRFVVGLVQHQTQSRQNTPAPKSPEKTAVETIAHALEALPRAKTDLLATGYAQKNLDTMCPSQIVLLHVAETWDVLQDDLFKWSNVPYWQSDEKLAAFDRQLAATRQRELIPTASELLPSLRMAGLVTALHERQLAVLRCIEALRLYLANHDAKLPVSLGDIKEVPIPLNPVTGKPFPYRLEGATAVLDADGGPPKRPQPQYRISVVR